MLGHLDPIILHDPVCQDPESWRTRFTWARTVSEATNHEKMYLKLELDRVLNRHRDTNHFILLSVQDFTHLALYGHFTCFIKADLSLCGAWGNRHIKSKAGVLQNVLCIFLMLTFIPCHQIASSQISWKNDFDMMNYLLFYMPNNFSNILYGHFP